MVKRRSVRWVNEMYARQTSTKYLHSSNIVTSKLKVGCSKPAETSWPGAKIATWNGMNYCFEVAMMTYICNAPRHGEAWISLGWAKIRKPQYSRY